MIILSLVAILLCICVSAICTQKGQLFSGRICPFNGIIFNSKSSHFLSRKMDLNFSLFDYFSPYVIKKTSYIYSLLKKLISYFISFLSIVLIFCFQGTMNVVIPMLSILLVAQESHYNLFFCFNTIFHNFSYLIMIQLLDLACAR